MQDTVTWLSDHHTDGVNLSIKELLSYQGKTNLLDLRPRQRIEARLSGAYLAKTKGRGMEFDEARHYQPGDDIRAIDWRVTARSGKTHTKVFREEKERPVFILVDQTHSMHFGTRLMFKSVQACHLASLVAWSAKKRGDRIGGILFNDAGHREYKPLLRQKAVLSLLNGMVNLHTVNEQLTETKRSHQANAHAFTDACARLRRLAHPGSLIFLISDFMSMDDAASQHLSHISRHCEIIAYPVSDPFEHALPDISVPQEVMVTDGQAQQSLILGDSVTSRKYREAHETAFTRMMHTLKQCHAQVIPISAAVPLETQLTGGRQ